jgi:hypothetical protein
LPDQAPDLFNVAEFGGALLNFSHLITSCEKEHGGDGVQHEPVAFFRDAIENLEPPVSRLSRQADYNRQGDGISNPTLHVAQSNLRAPQTLTPDLIRMIDLR